MNCFAYLGVQEIRNVHKLFSCCLFGCLRMCINCFLLIWVFNSVDKLFLAYWVVKYVHKLFFVFDLYVCLRMWINCFYAYMGV